MLNHSSKGYQKKISKLQIVPWQPKLWHFPTTTFWHHQQPNLQNNHSQNHHNFCDDLQAKPRCDFKIWITKIIRRKYSHDLLKSFVVKICSEPQQQQQQKSFLFIFHNRYNNTRKLFPVIIKILIKLLDGEKLMLLQQQTKIQRIKIPSLNPFFAGNQPGTTNVQTFQDSSRKSEHQQQRTGQKFQRTYKILFIVSFWL